MPIKILTNNKGIFKDESNKYIQFASEGLWNSIEKADIDQDGDEDLVLGNWGTNAQMYADSTQPIEMYYDDFDKNGSIDPLITHYIMGKSYPLVSMEDLIKQWVKQRKKFGYFKDYAKAQIKDILTKEQLETCTKKIVSTTKSIWLENKNGAFIPHEFPRLAQIAPVNDIFIKDINQDNNLDLILVGNKTHARVKLGKLDGNHGMVLFGNGKGNFEVNNSCGLELKDDIGKIKELKIQRKEHLIFGINNNAAKIYSIQ